MEREDETNLSAESETVQPTADNRPSPFLRFFFGRVFPWPFFVIGLIILIVGIRGALEANASTNWQTTTGTVTHSDVVTSKSRRGGPMFGASVVYEFDLEGSRHIGDRVTVANIQTSSRARALRVVERYPVGAEVTVYCHPSDPERSLLEPGLSASAFFMPGFGLVFFLAGTAMLIFLPKLLNNPNLNWTTA